MNKDLSKKVLLSLATTVAFISLTPAQAKAFLFVSSVANDKPGAVVNINYDPETNTITSSPNFTPGNSSILKYNETTGAFVDTFVQKGVLSLSSGITFGPDGDLYANDQGYAYTANGTTKYGRIVKFDGKTGNFLGEFIPGSTLTSKGLQFPEDLLFGPDGDLYISGLGGGGVQRFDGQTGAYVDTVADTNSKNEALIAAGLNFGPDGNLYISSVLTDNSILKYNLKSDTVNTFVPSSIAPPVPSGTVFTPDGSKLLGSTFLGANPGDPITVQQYSNSGADLGLFVGANNGGLESASRLKFGADGNLYVSDFAGNQVMRYDGQDGGSMGAFISDDTAINGGLKNPGGLAFSPIPEPSTYAGMLVFSAFVVRGSLLKNRQKEKVSKPNT